ncbi:hypothetical protein M6B38_287400 [Iris pallida]|uniref:Uncharacterized protein n=1 Tax=Iris pallida TaxID=29817 RepID=A0AAX6HWS7_IRIPA|nr:hypothetical protein M6B38_287400 [Iris pallida]
MTIIQLVSFNYIKMGQYASAGTTFHCFEKCIYHRPNLGH